MEQYQQNNEGAGEGYLPEQSPQEQINYSQYKYLPLIILYPYFILADTTLLPP